MQDQEQDRTEQATPFKLEESRNRGEVPRSTEVTSFALMLALLLSLFFLGQATWQRLCLTGSMLLAMPPAADAAGLLGLLVRNCLAIVLPFGVTAVVLALVASWGQTGPLFTFEPLQPRFDRIDPFMGFRRIFGRRLVFDAVKNLLKLVLLVGMGYLFFAGSWMRLMSQNAAGPGGQLVSLARSGATLLGRLVVALLVIAVVDLVFVRWQYRRQMMMSRRELREEIRRREGDPHIRARLRELQRENRRQSRSLGRIGDADVLITNPDHVCVALRYERERMSAPHVIAKGAGLWVMQMKLLAWRHSVPVREQRPLARHLFRFGAINRPVPPDTYVEVARLYADLEAHRRRAEGRYEVRA